MPVQTLTTPAGEELVVLSGRDYDALLARLGDEDAEDRMTLILAAEARADAPLPRRSRRPCWPGMVCLKRYEPGAV
jgi:hypothetical protein